MEQSNPERRSYLRIETPLTIRVIGRNNIVHRNQTKDISPLGLRFESDQENVNLNDEIELNIEIPNTLNPVHARAKVVWKKRISTKDGSSFDIGCEFIKVEEDNKNTFLKYFCDLLYGQAQ